MRILVADDDPIIREAFERMFEIIGHSNVIVGSGKELIEKVKSEPFDVIFLDVIFPDTDGVEIYKSIKKMKLDTPVVMMTGYAIKEKIKEAMELGALDYLYKPFDVQDVIHILLKLSRQKGLKPLRRGKRKK